MFFKANELRHALSWGVNEDHEIQFDCHWISENKMASGQNRSTTKLTKTKVNVVGILEAIILTASSDCSPLGLQATTSAYSQLGGAHGT